MFKKFLISNIYIFFLFLFCSSNVNAAKCVNEGATGYDGRCEFVGSVDKAYLPSSKKGLEEGMSQVTLCKYEMPTNHKQNIAIYYYYKGEENSGIKMEVVWHKHFMADFSNGDLGGVTHLAGTTVYSTNIGVPEWVLQGEGANDVFMDSATFNALVPYQNGNLEDNNSICPKYAYLESPNDVAYGYFSQDSVCFDNDGKYCTNKAGHYKIKADGPYYNYLDSDGELSKAFEEEKQLVDLAKDLYAADAEILLDSDETTEYINAFETICVRGLYIEKIGLLDNKFEEKYIIVPWEESSDKFPGEYYKYTNKNVQSTFMGNPITIYNGLMGPMYSVYGIYKNLKTETPIVKYYEQKKGFLGQNAKYKADRENLHKDLNNSFVKLTNLCNGMAEELVYQGIMQKNDFEKYKKGIEKAVDEANNFLNFHRKNSLTPNVLLDFNFNLPDVPTCVDYLGVATINYLQIGFNVIKYLAVIILLVLCIIDFIKAITSQDKDLLKKAINTSVKRLIIAIIIFFLPTVIDFLLKLFGIEDGTCGIR